MTFESLPFSPRQVKATESRLRSVYEAARAGLRGDALALASGMLPSEYRQLTQLDPVVELAEMKGRADSEIEMASIVRNAALAGDSKAALEFLKHRHDWVAKQQVQVDVTQSISIITALEQAQTRVIQGLIIDETPDRANGQGLLANNRIEDGNDFQHSNARQTQNATDV